MSILSYCPEMGQAKPEKTHGNVQLARSRGGPHYYVETPLTLKGQGIRFVEIIQSAHLTPRGQYKAGWNRYWVTDRAMKVLEAQYDFACENLLD